MLWLLPKVLTTPDEERDVRLIACDLAEAVLHFVPAGEERPRQAIETARRFVRGEATHTELVAARAAARDAARTSAGAAAGAARAALAALAAAGATWNAAGATWNAAWNAAESEARGAVRGAARASQADIIRGYWPVPPPSVAARFEGAAPEELAR